MHTLESTYRWFFSHSFGCGPPSLSSDFNIKRNEKCVSSECKKQGKDSCGASYCVFTFLPDQNIKDSI